MLPREDDDHMPPKQKPQLNEKEIALIHWWIDNGADFTKKVKDLKQPEIIKPYLLELQSDHVEEKKTIPNIPPEPVEKADEKDLQPLVDKGAIIIRFPKTPIISWPILFRLYTSLIKTWLYCNR